MANISGYTLIEKLYETYAAVIASPNKLPRRRKSLLKPLKGNYPGSALLALFKQVWLLS
jgi:hypothetical protein